MMADAEQNAEEERNIEQVKEAIGDELLLVLVDSYGAGADQVEVLLQNDVVVVIMDVRLTQAEQTLMNAGHGDSVRTVREGYQAAIAPTFRAIVERATGRRTTAFLSSMSVEPVYAVEVFRLAPAAA